MNIEVIDSLLVWLQIWRWHDIES